MLLLQHISLLQYRNYAQKEVRFFGKVVCICGSNGSGKTNLLDAIYYLGFTKSYFYRTDAQNVQHGLQGMRLQGNFLLNNEPQEVTAIIRENHKKEFGTNGVWYKKFSEHIGLLPCVMIAPDDINLIVGGSEERRKFIDTILSQIDSSYLHQLIDYNKVLQQRNSLLKQAADTQLPINEALLGVLDEQLVQYGNLIFQLRHSFLEAFIQLALQYYQRIANQSDQITITYESDLKKSSFASLLSQARHKDQILQRTTVGIHKDDLLIKMEDSAFKNEASQGQRKSLLFALKLAEWQSLYLKKGFYPLLLLDDVFEKLDQQRMHNLLEWVCTQHSAQVFITDTHPERLHQQLTQLSVDYQLIQI